MLDTSPANPQSRAAWERFKRLTAEKQQKAEIVTSGGVAAVETVDRLATRMRILNPLDGLGRERVFGTNDMLPVNYLLLGTRVARSVGRIQVRDLAGRHQGFGTGFLISSNLLLTNHHVLDTLDVASRSLVEFDVEEDEQFRPRLRRTFRLDPTLFFTTAPTWISPSLRLLPEHRTTPRSQGMVRWD
jgi:endonuclease G